MGLHAGRSYLLPIENGNVNAYVNDGIRLDSMLIDQIAMSLA